MMGVIANIDYDNYPKQRGEHDGPTHVGSRVGVCYYYDTSKAHMGTIVRDDAEAPYQTII